MGTIQKRVVSKSENAQKQLPLRRSGENKVPLE